MGKTFLALGAALALTSPSQAAMIATLPAPAAPIHKAQLLLPDPLGLFGFGGRQYCWYDDGWRGEGWYWCGYGYREGYGWGGGEGFHGWGEHRSERDWRREDAGGGDREDDDNGGPPPLAGPGFNRPHREGGGFHEGGQNHGGGGFREGGQHQGGGGGGFREGGQNHGGGGGFHEGGQNHGGGGGFRQGGHDQGGQNRGPGAPINGAPSGANRGAGGNGAVERHP